MEWAGVVKGAASGVVFSCSCSHGLLHFSTLLLLFARPHLFGWEGRVVTNAVATFGYGYCVYHAKLYLMRELFTSVHGAVLD